MCILPFFYSCTPTRFTPANYQGHQIAFGSSGGVAGFMKEYNVLDNGQVFLSKGMSGEWKELEKLKKSTTREIFNKSEALGLSTMKFSHPGNMTYHLTVKQPSQSNEIQWGESGITPPDGIAEFYAYLISLF